MDLSQPLAHILRPTSLENYVGQSHLVGPNGPITRLCEQQQLCSMILWGPPGCGKTSLVHLLEKYWQLPVINMSAINSGIKDIKSITSSTSGSLFQESKIVFVDEIHRFNKTQQDAFLPHVENGDIVLIGATTENPAFSVNSALLSRMRVFTLQSLQHEDLRVLIERALDYINSEKSTRFSINDDAFELLLNLSEGDARRLLSNFEVAINLIGNDANALSINHVTQACGERIGNFDKQGDHYYDILSAFHKSIRGSSVDGGLYWFARLLLASSDITPICRRLLAIATEDIGNADPNAMQICLNAWDLYHRVGAQEGERAVAQAVIYCALAPKSNAVYNAFKAAKRLAKMHPTAPIPLHLRNSTSSITKELGHGEGYQYAHNYEHAYSPEQHYLPDGINDQDLYQPAERGLEKKLKDKMAFLASLRQGTI
ncbi:replication-associated recombination protein A [Glaciecola sp. 2405UD65-10]|uniref:replication-associated recombination protein A n=1 Tax=Glaciecola sp. 2405UD65-10 TaxID=3397244 RepID=UPI003B5C8B65